MLKYLKSKTDDVLLAWNIPPDAPNRAEQMKELEDALDPVMGWPMLPSVAV